jgi:hypothetical protein
VLKGIVQNDSNGTPVPHAVVSVSGFDSVPLLIRMIPAPISPTFRELHSVKTDPSGRFFITVPYHKFYQVRAAGDWGYWSTTQNEAELTSSDILISVKEEPNKAPEPTSCSVTPRAILSCSELKQRTANSNAARVAPEQAVAHL